MNTLVPPPPKNHTGGSEVLEPAIPMDEEKRLATLRGLNILETPPEERFDRLTRLAQRTLDAPIALVSLVDSDRQWFKSCQGLYATPACLLNTIKVALSFLESKMHNQRGVF